MHSHGMLGVGVCVCMSCKLQEFLLANVPSRFCWKSGNDLNISDLISDFDNPEFFNFPTTLQFWCSLGQEKVRDRKREKSEAHTHTHKENVCVCFFVCVSQFPCKFA